MKLLLLLPFVVSSFLAVPVTKEPALDDLPFSKDRMLKLVNEARKKGCKCGGKYYGPAPALTWNDDLEKAAKDHSKDMAKNKFLSHTSSKGSSPGERIRKAGYAWTNYAENIAHGYSDEAAVVKGWLSSPGHCRNIMGKQYREMGAARSGLYWTQDFGTR